MKISDSSVLLYAQTRQQTIEADWQTLADSGPPISANLFRSGPSFQDFLTGQLDLLLEKQKSGETIAPGNFASEEVLQLVRELDNYKEGVAFLDELRLLSQTRPSFGRQTISSGIMSSYNFFSSSGNGVFVGNETWSGSYRLRFSQPFMPQLPPVSQGGDVVTGGGRAGRGSSPFSQTIRQDTWHFRQEKQELDFAALGTVTTEDGRTISFDLDRTYNQSVDVLSAETSYFSGRALIDPLVLDLEGEGVSFSSESIDFDLDADGELDRLSCLGEGCGFLAYDSNGDGLVNNGLELFGVTSGSGFAELAAYDGDDNYWIDENDAIYNDLSIWFPTADGNGLLQSLQEADVGAIYLADVGSSFEIVGDDGELLGQISGSGVYLTESGNVEAVHQVDIAVQDQDEEPLAMEAEDVASENIEETSEEVNPEDGQGSEVVTV